MILGRFHKSLRAVAALVAGLGMLPKKIGSLMFLILLGGIVSGCVGSEGAEQEGPSSVEDDALHVGMGILSGRVLDDEFRSLENATVAVPALDVEQSTGADGTYRLVNLAPGAYDAIAVKLGYQAQGRRVEIEADETTEVTFTLTPLPANGTYYELYAYVGFQPCQWYFEGALAHCTYPYTNAYGTAKRNGVNLSNYGLPPDVQDNRDRYFYPVRLDHTGGVGELFWQASSAAAAWEILIVDCAWYDPFWDECVPPGSPAGTTGTRYITKVGRNPIRIEWKHPNPKHLELLPKMMLRANVYGDPSGGLQAGLAFDQKIQMYSTVFYGSPPPEGFTAGPRDG